MTGSRPGVEFKFSIRLATGHPSSENKSYHLVYDGLSPKTVKGAWVITLAKWETIVNILKESPKMRLLDQGEDTCGLCMFFTKTKDCSHKAVGICPVAKDTGMPLCLGTPFYGWYESSTLDAATAELEYLRGVYKRWQVYEDQNRVRK